MTRLFPLTIFALEWVATYAISESSQPSVEFPVVDLGYGRYQASFNVSIFLTSRHCFSNMSAKLTGNYYNFSNIRYAEPPLGSLRFNAPVPPKGRNRTIDDGSVARICPQAYPAGSFVNQIYNTYYSQTGRTDLEGFQNATQGFDYPRNTPQDPRATEDCLFLDVMVPRKVFQKRSLRSKRPQRGAAVMVWIHGGGYGAGTKYDVPPSGLVSRSQRDDEDGVIFVAIGYRL
jgi:cholinesterase